MSLIPPGLSRRRFVTGLAASGALASSGLLTPRHARAARPAPTPTVLTGTEFNLDVVETPVNITGRPRIATCVNGQFAGPTLRWREGTEVTLHVTNRLKVDTSIHWHGLILPVGMDGVPGLSFPGIRPGETFTYRFPVRQSGTYWYHAHSGFQEQTGLAAPLIIDPAGPDPIEADREHVIFLGDWSDTPPATIQARLKKMSHYYNHGKPTLGNLPDGMWATMRMDPSDLADVSGAAYTYLVNGQPPAANWTGLFRPGETVRLRLINGSASTIFDLRIPGLTLTVVAADGQPVAPVAVDELRLNVAEIYDVLVRPADDRAYTLFAQSIDRSGFARATLAPRAGMSAAVPAMDPRVRLDMIDMMGAMSHGDHGGHAGHGAPPLPARHASSEFGPSVDMRVDSPRDNLDDPGIGLRDNGRRVLTYADLRTLGGPLDARAPARDIELHLTGNMERYVWGFDGLAYPEGKPIHLTYGERVRFVLVNDTMMTHPIHLHGMWSELEDQQGRFLVRKHTVSVQPAQRVRFGVTADAPGRWAFHCHLLYHMAGGMFREVIVA